MSEFYGPYPSLNMGFEAYRDFIGRNFHWQNKYISVKLIKKLLAKHQANQLVEKNGEIHIEATLLVGIQITKVAKCLMVVRKLIMSKRDKGRVVLYPGSSQHQLGLIATTRELVAIDKPIPKMLQRPFINSSGELTLDLSKINTGAWLIPQLKPAESKDGLVLEWVPIRQVLNLPAADQRISTIYRRIRWETGPWPKDSRPTSQLMYRDIDLTSRTLRQHFLREQNVTLPHPSKEARIEQPRLEPFVEEEPAPAAVAAAEVVDLTDDSVCEGEETAEEAEAAALPLSEVAVGGSEGAFVDVAQSSLSRSPRRDKSSSKESRLSERDRSPSRKSDSVARLEDTVKELNAWRDQLEVQFSQYRAQQQVELERHHQESLAWRNQQDHQNREMVGALDRQNQVLESIQHSHRDLLAIQTQLVESQKTLADGLAAIQNSRKRKENARPKVVKNPAKPKPKVTFAPTVW